MDLMAWAKPEAVLLTEELDCVSEYMQLYEAVLDDVCDGVEPTSLNYVEARCITQDLWVFQRHCGSADALNALQSASHMGPAECRRQAYRDMDDRTRLRGMVLHAVKQTRQMFDSLGRSVYMYSHELPENLVPLRRGQSDG
tara:strand:+ start:889 stop:1311 length:423 start_codon:yes stop_codon:yes gene_type:complete